MKASEILEKILSLNKDEKYPFGDGIEIQMRGYDGIVAKKQRNNNNGRLKIGLFDFKIISNNIPPTHIDILHKCVEIGITNEDLSYVYNGEDPCKYDSQKRIYLQLIQLLFVEQEVNYGKEEFQAHKVMLSARNYFMIYLLETISMHKKNVDEFIKSLPIDNNGRISKLPDSVDQYKYITINKKLKQTDWLHGDILEKYRNKSKLSYNNTNTPSLVVTPTLIRNSDKQIKILVVDLDYVIENNETIARVFGRIDTGERAIVKIRGTRPFFLVRIDAVIPDDPRIVEEKNDGWVDIKGNPLKIIYTRFPHDVAKRGKCKTCSGEGRVVIDSVVSECPDCEGSGEIETGLKSLFGETWQADIVYSQVLRIYYGLSGVIEVPSNFCHISEVKPSTTVIHPYVDVFDIETVDCLDTVNAPEPIPCFTIYDEPKNTYHLFCYDFKKHELAQVKMRLQQHWSTNLVPKLLKYNFHNPNIVFHDFDNPRAMTGSLINFKRTSNPDIIAPWNKTFDMPYIYQYMKNLQLPVDTLSETNRVFRTKENTIDIEGTTEIDLMEEYASIQFSELRAKTLDFCANREFGVGKMKRSSIKEMLKKDPVGLLAYNIVDVQITYALMRECQILSNMQTITNICNAGLDNQSPLRIVDSFIMTYLRPKKIAVPTNVYVKRDDKKEGGAFVHKASVGKHQNIIVLDFKSYYTSVMMDGNVCASKFVTREEVAKEVLHEVFNDKTPARQEDIDAAVLEYIHRKYIHAPNGAIFKKDSLGIIPEILIHVRNERARHKKLMKEAPDEQTKNVEDRLQAGFKRIGNIFYGQFKNPHFRFMNKMIAEAITSICKALTIRTIDTIEHLNDKDIIDLLTRYKDILKISDDAYTELSQKLQGTVLIVRYGDTDSILIQLPLYLNGNEMRIVGLILEKYINSLLPSFTREMFNIDNKYIEIEFDTSKRMKAFIQMPSKVDKSKGAKKRYAYIAYRDDDTLDTTPHFVGMDVIRSDTAPLMAEIQTKVASMILNDKPYAELAAYLNDAYRNFNKQKIDSLLIKETIHAFDKAISHSPQLIGAMYANKFMNKKFKTESTVYYIFLKSMPNGYPQHVQTKWGLLPVKTLCLNYNESVPSQFIPFIDWDKMRELVVEGTVETILEAMDYSWGGILTGTVQNKIKQIIVPTATEIITVESNSQLPAKKPTISNSFEA